MAKKLLIAFVFLISCLAANAQIQNHQPIVPQQYVFFQGDSLDGFDMNAAFTALGAAHAKINLTEFEKRLFMYKKQLKFVQNKFHIPSRPDKKVSATDIEYVNSKNMRAPFPQPLLAGCNNFDFESGNLTNWSGDMGFNYATNPSSIAYDGVGMVGSGTTNAALGNCSGFNIMSNGTDYYSGLTRVHTGGSFSLRLGGDNVNLGYDAYGNPFGSPDCGYGDYWSDASAGEVTDQYITVTAANCLITYYYNVILQGAPHGAGAQPFFNASVYDHLGHKITCSDYFQEAPAGSGTAPANYSTSAHVGPSDNTEPVYYSGWQANSFNLTAQIGTTVDMRFMVAGCAGGQHFAYAYVDGTCGPLQLSIPSPSACAGGTMTVTSPPMPPGTTFAWTGPGILGSTTGSSIIVSANGTYTVVMTPAAPNNGCPITVSSTVTFSAPATITPSQSNISCNGAGNGTATATASNGSTPYTYSWTGAGYGGGGQSTNTATGLASGTYTCTVTTTNGCKSSQTFTIVNPSVLSSSVTAQANVSCNGGSNATATVTPSGGTGTYTYSWSPSPGGGQGTASGTGLSNGTYNCTITDQNGCSHVQAVTITQPATALSIAPSSTQTGCGVSTGSATGTAGGGTGAYTYSWSPAPGGGQGTNTATSLGGGTYTLTLHDNNGCVQTHSFAITSAAAPSSSITAQSDASCNTSCNGSVTVTPSGGAGGYSYTWSPSGGSAATASSLCAGTYHCTITDLLHCTTVQAVTIIAPAVLSASTSAQTNANCNGSSTGTATVAPTGGTSAYAYNWTGAGYGGGGQGTATATGLASGTYTCTVTDAHSCTYPQVVTITQPTVLSTSISAQTNVACNGNSTGSATVAPAGGTTSYTYNWTGTGYGGGGQGTGTATGLASGTYTCTVTDAHSCSNAHTVTIVQPVAPLSASVSGQSNVACNGGFTGSATVAPAGGTTNYTYSWSGASYGGAGQGTATATSLSNGTYTCTITDANACSYQQLVTITQPVAPLSGSVTAHTNELCNGNSSGSATVTPTGGTTNYTYNWSGTGYGGGGQGTATAVSLAAGSYTCSITDANGCVHNQAITIIQPVVLSSSVSSQSDVKCNGGSTGSATVAPTGGTGTYTYNWSPAPGAGQGTATATGLANGSYNCTITDANGCTRVQAVSIAQPVAPLSSSITAQSNVNCNGGATGSATILASGGTSAYGYNWSPAPGAGQGTSSATGLSNGTYNVTITDANSCTYIQPITITQPVAALSSSVSAQTNVDCNGGSTGSASVSPAGGTTNYTYSWVPAPGAGQGTASATGLSNGTYNVTITDANSCTHVQPITITQPVVLSSSVSTQTNVACNGGATGSATVAPAGGTTNYTYSWSPAPGGGQNTATATGLSNGTYTCNITDAHGCTHSQAVAVTQPAAALSLTPSSTQTGCGTATGTAGVVANGGTSGYSYVWNPAPGAGQGTANATGLASGTFTVTVTDAHSCTQTSSFNITAAGGPTASIASQAPAKCNASCDGSATIAPLGGTGAYTYSWSPSGGTGISASGLCANTTYTCTIKDANNCSTTQNVLIAAPVILSSTPAQTSVDCKGNATGTASVNVTGGTSNYTYSWYGGVIGGGQTASTATGLTAGTYTCAITDANGCTASNTVTVTQPATLLALTPSSTSTGCGTATGSASVATVGGTGADTYTWTPGNPTGQGTNTITGLAAGSYTVIVQDANSCPQTSIYTIGAAAGPSASIASQAPAKCNASCDGTASITASGGAGGYGYSWSGGAGSSASAAGLCANTTYTCTITDANNCVTTQTVSITAPAVLSSTPSATSVDCKGNATGTATMAVIGGTSNYTYSWSGGPIGGGQTNATATGLTAGTYSCAITDANGCETSNTITVTQPVTSVSAVPAATPTGCGIATGTAMVTASGGTGAHTYTWAPGNPTGQGTDSISALAVGSYTVTIHDANGCAADSIIKINATGAPSSSIASQSAALCNASCNGTATVSATGGAGGYSYNWSPSGGGAATASGLCAGAYVCTITDANNCATTQSVTIGQPTVLAVTPTHTDALCNGGNTGIAVANVTGGTSSYTYSWTSGGMAMTETGLTAGNDTCHITDANGCTLTQVYTIGQPAAALAITPTQTNALCNGASNGTLTALVTGGTAGYNYTWSVPGSGATVSGLSAGTYTLTVTDAHNCSTGQQTYTITQPVALSATTTPVSATCSGSNGSAVATPAGGTPAYTYSWSSGSTTASAGNLAPGNYSCMVTDSNHCTTTVTTTVINTGTKPVAGVSVVAGSASFCAGTQSILSASGGGTYHWSNGATTDSITVTTAGTYSVVVTNTCGSDSTHIVMTVLPQPNPVITGNSGMCSGDSILLTASGGNSYLWNTGATGSAIWVKNTGSYSVNATNTCGTVSSVSFPVTVNTVSAFFNASTLAGSMPLPVNFTDSSTAATTWTWNYGDGNSANGQTGANETYGTPGTYTATLTVTNGSCTSTYSRVIVVGEIPSFITIPNVFSPNGDGLNDNWYVNYAGIDYFNCKIYDRWGVAMAELIAPGTSWDGRTLAGEPASDGTYFYTLHAKGDDGKVYDQTGFITLVRPH